MTASDEPAPAPTPENALSAFFARVKPYVERVKTNLDPISKILLIVWQISLFLGGILFVVYFFSTGFLPELDLQASVTLLITAALTGMFLIFWFFYHLVSTRTYVFIAYKGERHFFAVSVIVFLIMLLAIRFKWPTPQQSWIYAIIVLAVLAVLLAVISKDVKLLFLPFQSIVAIQGFLVSFLIVNRLSSTEYEVYFAVGVLIIINIFLVYTSSFPDTHKYGLWRYIMIIAAVASVIIMLGDLAFIPNAIMRIYKLGHFQAASLVLDRKACEIAKGHGLSDSCPCHFNDVKIHSRLGSTYYIEGRKDEEPVCFTIPSSEVLSWTFNGNKQPSEKEWRKGCNQSNRSEDEAKRNPTAQSELPASVSRHAVSSQAKYISSTSSSISPPFARSERTNAASRSSRKTSEIHHPSTDARADRPPPTTPSAGGA